MRSGSGAKIQHYRCPCEKRPRPSHPQSDGLVRTQGEGDVGRPRRVASKDIAPDPWLSDVRPAGPWTVSVCGLQAPRPAVSVWQPQQRNARRSKGLWRQGMNQTAEAPSPPPTPRWGHSRRQPPVSPPDVKPARTLAPGSSLQTRRNRRVVCQYPAGSVCSGHQDGLRQPLP